MTPWASDTDVLKAISAEDARSILIFLCNDSRVCQKATSLAAKFLSVSARKRKAEYSVAICVQCDDVFEPDHNITKDCQYHSGTLEVDYEGDFWADHDENCHGIIDTKEMREEYPEGFRWTCCDKLGSAPGCRRSRHRADPYKSTKGSELSESEEEVVEQDEDGNSEEEEDDDNEGGE